MINVARKFVLAVAIALSVTALIKVGEEKYTMSLAYGSGAWNMILISYMLDKGVKGDVR